MVRGVFPNDEHCKGVLMSLCGGAMDVAEAADELAAAALEVADSWDADSGAPTNRFIAALTKLQEKYEVYTFIRRERQVQAKR
jgi:hypothetical protein